MILREILFDRFTFTCTGCDHAWSTDYDVQHVEDGHGHERDYFFRHGLLCSDPTGPGETTCPHCGRTSVLAHHDARPAAPDRVPEVQAGPPAGVPEAMPIPAPALIDTQATEPVFSGAR